MSDFSGSDSGSDDGGDSDWGDGWGGNWGGGIGDTDGDGIGTDNDNNTYFDSIDGGSGNSGNDNGGNGYDWGGFDWGNTGIGDTDTGGGYSSDNTDTNNTKDTNNNNTKDTYTDGFDSWSDFGTGLRNIASGDRTSDDGWTWAKNGLDPVEGTTAQEIMDTFEYIEGKGDTGDGTPKPKPKPKKETKETAEELKLRLEREKIARDKAESAKDKYIKNRKDTGSRRGLGDKGLSKTEKLNSASSILGR